MVDDKDLVRGKSVVAVIAYRESSVIPTDAVPGERPERIVASDPLGRFHKVHHHAGNPDGTYETDSPEYWRELTDALAPAGAILVSGTAWARRTRPTTGSRTSSSTVRTSPPRSSPTCAPISTTSTTSRC